MTAVEQLRAEEVREALRLLGEPDAPPSPSVAQRLLRETLTGYGTVRSLLERAPEGARVAFVRLAQDGPAPVDALLGRGWWGRGSLPPPLDWLQRRALVAVEADGRVAAVDEARAGFLALTLDLEPARPPDVAAPVQVLPARTVVVAPDAASLQRALAVPDAGLRELAPTVAVSGGPPAAVEAALRADGVALAVDEVVAAAPAAPALPGTPEEAVGPRAVRALLERAVDERRQVRLEYFASSRGGVPTERVVDPWTFRDDLLSGYCHLRSGERTFAVDRIGRALLLPTSLEHDAGAR